jgi:hypothetical protein
MDATLYGTWCGVGDRLAGLFFLPFDRAIELPPRAVKDGWRRRKFTAIKRVTGQRGVQACPGKKRRLPKANAISTNLPTEYGDDGSRQ